MNKDKVQNQNILGTLVNKDESGIIAYSDQIYDKKSDRSLEEENVKQNERLNNVEAKDRELQSTLEGITKTGEASAASNVTYNHNDSKLDATNVQQAVDEIASAVATETSRAQEAEANRYTKNETYTKEEVNNLISTKTQIFDISAYHATGGTLATYDNLEDALGTNGKNIPQSLRKGGMSVKFVQTSDNKYVQYRLMATSFSITESDWQGVDDEPTAGSDNLVKSGGVYSSTPTVADSTINSDFDISDERGNLLARFAGGHLRVKNFSSADILESIQAILSNIGFDNVPEFDEEIDYAVDDVVRHGKYIYVFTSAHTAGEWDETEVEKTVINTEHPVEVSESTTESDLDISDENGKILFMCKNGHIKTKHFDSSQIIGEEQMANILTGIQNLNTRVDNMSMPKGIILDTDWWTDVDDAVAIRCLLWAERCGLVDLVGVCVDAVNSTSGKSIAAFLNEEGRGGLAIGMDKQATDYTGNPPYHSTCINNWAYYDDILSNDNCEDCVSFYRRALVNSSKKIDIICTGYGNALQRLLNSTADSISPLTGRELITEKVNKLWWMAGNYPSGSENNFNRTSRSSAAGADICTNWTTPIIFLGYEVGAPVISGNNLSKDVDSNDLLYKCLVAHGSGNGRSSWDPMTVLLACYDNFDIAGYTVVQGINSVNASTGANTFTVNNQGNHYYVVKKYANWWYAHQINKIISLTSWTSRKLGAQQIDRL